MFDILGNGIFNVDHELWEFHRKTTLSIMSHAKFQTLLERNMWYTFEKGLQPIFYAFAEQGKTLDLQDVFQRFTFDSITKLLLDHDPRSLSIDLPFLPYEKAFGDALDAVLHRHIMPESCWKLQKWLQIGKEKKLTQAWEALDQFIYPCILQKQEELMNKTIKDEDTFLNLMLAGRDTTSAALTWFFWLLAKNPSVKTKIRDEIQQQLHLKKDENVKFFNKEETQKLIYLHAALCETLRLFPSVS
uniref:Cytochrome P450 86B1-like n=1 Tax=Nicotiana sylvestris TaxID=4096 RepID=A0A1U7WLL0_NICSY|nr:PREDICTED: cytochrome P450 86B1-like [Nicotiana sylvestris]